MLELKHTLGFKRVTSKSNCTGKGPFSSEKLGRPEQQCPLLFAPVLPPADQRLDTFATPPSIPKGNGDHRPNGPTDLPKAKATESRKEVFEALVDRQRTGHRKTLLAYNQNGADSADSGRGEASEDEGVTVAIAPSLPTPEFSKFTFGGHMCTCNHI